MMMISLRFFVTPTQGRLTASSSSSSLGLMAYVGILVTCQRRAALYGSASTITCSLSKHDMVLIIWPRVIAYSMGQITKSVCVCQCVSVSVCQSVYLSVCEHSHGRIS